MTKLMITKLVIAFFKAIFADSNAKDDASSNKQAPSKTPQAAVELLPNLFFPSPKDSSEKMYTLHYAHAHPIRLEQLTTQQDEAIHTALLVTGIVGDFMSRRGQK